MGRQGNTDWSGAWRDNTAVEGRFRDLPSLVNEVFVSPILLPSAGVPIVTPRCYAPHSGTTALVAVCAGERRGNRGQGTGNRELGTGTGKGGRTLT